MLQCWALLQLCQSPVFVYLHVCTDPVRLVQVELPQVHPAALSRSTAVLTHDAPAPVPLSPFHLFSRKLKRHSSPSLSTLISELLFFKSFFYFSITCATWWDRHIFCPLVIAGWSCYLQRRPTVLQRKETPRWHAALEQCSEGLLTASRLCSAAPTPWKMGQPGPRSG